MTQKIQPSLAAEKRPVDGDGTKRPQSIWRRLIFMICVALLYGLSRAVVIAVTLAQFLWVLFSAQTNPRLACLAESLAIYTYQIVRYLTFVTDRRPFPFDQEWPQPAVQK